MDFLLALIGVVQRLSVSSHASGGVGRSHYRRGNDKVGQSARLSSSILKIFLWLDVLTYNNPMEMKPMNILGQSISELSNRLYEAFEKEEEADGGFGLIDLESFEIAVIEGLHVHFPESSPLYLSMSATDERGKMQHSKVFAIEIDGRLYTAWGEKTMKEIEQGEIDFFTVGIQEEGGPLPEGWRLLSEPQPFSDHGEMPYEEVRDAVARELPAVLAEKNASLLSGDTPTVERQVRRPGL